MMEEAQQQKLRPWWPVLGGGIGAAALLWVYFLIDLEQLRATIENADPLFLAFLPVAIAAEQLVRAWKWRQLLFVIKSVATLRLFGAIMAGYLANLLVPLGVSPFVRSWMVARLDDLKMSAVLATVAVDRLIDGIVFLGFVAVVLAFAVFPDPTGNLRLGLIVGGGGSLVLFPLLLIALARHRRNMLGDGGLLLRLAKFLPERAAKRCKEVLHSFADGVVWPRQPWRRGAIVIASALIKLIAAGHFLWAGLAFGVVLAPIDYLFLVVFLGFLIIITRFARIPGAFVVGGIFALGLLGVGEEEALAMVVSVQFATMISVAVVGAIALWRNGISLDHMRTHHPERGP